MIEIEGKYNSAKIFTNIVDESSMMQVKNLLNHNFIKNSRIRFMPDIHAGVGCTIGTTMTIKDKIAPNLVGVDIGCGMLVTKFGRTNRNLDLKSLDKFIHAEIPSGFNVHSVPYIEDSYIIDRLNSLKCKKSVNINYALASIGTLGGGNHFIELDKDDEDYLYLVIHSGSRHLGVQIAKYYVEQARKQIIGKDRNEIQKIINQLKIEGREQEIENTVKELRENIFCTSDDLVCVSGALMEDYLHDMKVAQEFAALNRYVMADKIYDKICKDLKVCILDQFITMHNYIDLDKMILRKGAVSANKGEDLIIPMNMRDGALLCTGKGNVDWNYSAPHGAGRLMSRAKARENLTLTNFKKEMEGIYSSTVSRKTIDEAPMAYKNMEDIIKNIGDTVTIDKVIKPIYNFKAEEEEGKRR